MIVYRVENRLGKGPYVDNLPLESKWRNPTDLHPTFEKNIPYDTVFGFTSMEKLYRWFIPELREELDGYEISVYESSEVVEDPVQCVFKKGELLYTTQL